MGDITISFIPHSSGASDPFWAIEQSGWEVAIEQLGVEGRFQGPQEFDPQQQVQNINSAISSEVDGIATSISDPDLFEDPLGRAREEGIPVLAVNIPEFGERTLPYQGYVGNDETVVGTEVASNAIEAFRETVGETPARAVIPNHQPGNTVLGLRSEGIREVLNGNDVPVDEITTSADPSENISALSSYRSSNSDVDLVLSLGPASGQPAVQWIDENDLQGEVYVAGVDITETIMQAIENDVYFGTVIQQPYLQGYLAGHYLAQKLANGIISPTVTPTGPSWIDASRLDVVRTQIENTGGA
jgi:simple sugar transport system substrate-binding protein